VENTVKNNDMVKAKFDCGKEGNRPKKNSNNAQRLIFQTQFYGISYCRRYSFKFNTNRLNSSIKVSLQEPDLANTTKQKPVQRSLPRLARRMRLVLRASSLGDSGAVTSVLF
jgi:hypothetical protein